MLINQFAEMLLRLRNRHLLVLDLLAFCVTPVLALWLRMDDLNSLVRYAEPLAFYALVAILIRWMIFIHSGLYSRCWRYASIDELARIIFAAVTATTLITLVFFGILRPFGLISNNLPRSIPLLDGILALLAVGGLRYSIRLAERMRQHRQKHPENSTRVVILGAGEAGSMIVKEMRANPQLGLEPVAFLDDDRRKHGTFIHGVRVAGDRHRIRKVITDDRAQQAIIAMPTAPGKTIRELTRLCYEVDLPVKTVPGVFELLDGSITVNQLRSVDIADLLRREPVATDLSLVERLLKGKRVLVTGAGGSIGGELCRQIARCAPAELILVGHGENSIYEINNELRRKFESRLLPAKFPIVPVIADIRDLDRMRTVVEHYHPQVIFHAAAHKHVPLMEENAADAITNNVLATRNLLQVAASNGIERLVFISTDKAVNPTSIMGATKRVAELLVQDTAARTKRCFVSVRFGNVLDSRGSVVPLFRQQIAHGGPVTVTHPEVQRYFMMIPEAVQLVLQAAALGNGGETFCLDMGEPVRVADLARDLIRLSGMEVERDIEIVFTGMRPGEKMNEELHFCDEDYGKTTCEKIFVARNGAHHVSIPEQEVPCLQSRIDALIAAARAGDAAEIRRVLQMIVPEYKPNNQSVSSV